MPVARNIRKSKFTDLPTKPLLVQVDIKPGASAAARRRHAPRKLHSRAHTRPSDQNSPDHGLTGFDSYLLDQLQAAVISTDMAGRVVSWNRFAESLYGWRRQEAVGHPIGDLIIGPREARQASGILSQIRERGHWEGEFTFHRKDGSSFPAYIIDSLIDDEQNTPVGIIGVSVDMTERRAAEQKIREHAATQAQLLRRLLHAHEAERRRLSIDIHDGPLQSLGVSLMALDRAVRRYERGEQDAAMEELKLLRTTLANTVGEIRAVLADLSDEILNTYGLSTALTRHGERFAEITGINTQVSTNLNRRLPADTEVLIYRLAQEAMANIRKHSFAQNAKIALQILGNILYLKVVDDGRGFDVEATLAQYEDGRHLGLKSMRERIQAAGGDLAIASVPGKGTALEFRCPVPPKEQTLTLLSEDYLNSAN